MNPNAFVLMALVPVISGCRTGELEYRPPSPEVPAIFEVSSSGEESDLSGRLVRGVASELQERGLPAVVVGGPARSGGEPPWTVQVELVSAKDSEVTARARATERETGRVLYEGSVSRSTGALMNEEDRLRRCAAAVADGLAHLIATQYQTELAFGKQPGRRIALPHSRRVFVTRNPLPPDSYDVVQEIRAGKAWYGSTNTVLNALAAQAQKKGADAVIEVETWFRPTWVAVVAPQASGKAVILRDPCEFESLRVQGEFLPADREWGGTDEPITELCRRQRE